MTLTQYHNKRDFSKTSEPKGKINAKNARLFIIQKHEASHLHYDFRLEFRGVLKSWTIPKGPCLDPHVKRLAIHVEDHPIEYANFEGAIPKGQYGGGIVMLWDKGIWKSLDKNAYAAYKKGHLRFELQAEKLKGRWDLIRFKNEKHWVLIKYQDKYAYGHDNILELDKSVLTNRTMREIAQNANKIALDNVMKKDEKLLEHLKKTHFPDFITPQLASLVDKPPEGDQWLHEIKFDGYRILSFKKGNHVVLKSRNDIDWTDNFPEVVQALTHLDNENIILDGEIVALDKHGKSNFQLLQNSMKNKNTSSFVYFVFDILYFNQFDLRKLPLLERKSILKNILSTDSYTLKYSDHRIDEGQIMFKEACHLELEGIVSKKINAPYVSMRNKSWLKVKCLKRQEFVVGGYTYPQHGRAFFGSLLLGVYNKKGQLEYAGRVGTGFNKSSLKEIYQKLIKLKNKDNPFHINPPSSARAHWVFPQLVGEVAFTEWTTNNYLRHPSFKGLRLDKKATDVVREIETPVKLKNEDASSNKKINIILTHPDKVLYPEDEITKDDLLNYYEAVSDCILPFITQRPLTLLRCPSHYKECFYQRHYIKTISKALHSIEIETKEEKVARYIYLNDKKGLLSLVQMSVLEIHPWGSKTIHIEKPDVIVFDLDPAPNVAWKQVVSGALEIRDYLTAYQLTSFVKSTGGKGLHVVIPIQAEYDWDDIKMFTQTFAKFLEIQNPHQFTSTMTKSKRTKKIFVDYLRNQRSATSISAYSTRARIHAPVSTPLAWDELSSNIEDNLYTIKTLPQRLEKLKDDPWKDFWTIKQSLKLDKI